MTGASEGAEPLAISALAAERVVFYLVFLSGFFGAALGGIDLGPLTLFPYRILLFGLWMLFAARFLMSGGRVRLLPANVRPQLAFLVAWLVYALLSVSWAPSRSLAIRGIFLLFSGVSAIFFFSQYVRKPNHFHVIFRLWIGAYVLLLAVGIWEYTTGNHLPISGLYGEARLRFMHMPTGIFRNSNDFATFLALGLPLVMGYVRFGRGRLLRIAAVGAILVSLGLIAATHSRANLIAVAVELGVFIGLLGSPGRRLRLWGLICLFGLILATVWPEPIEELAQSVQMDIASVSQTAQGEGVRLDLIRNGLHFLRMSGGMGVGAGNLEYYMKTQAVYPTSGVLSVHNWWVETLANYGILLFGGYVAFYLGIVIGLFRTSRRWRTRFERLIGQAMILSLAAFPASSLSSSSIMGLVPHWLLFGFALSFLGYSRTLERRSEQ